MAVLYDSYNVAHINHLNLILYESYLGRIPRFLFNFESDSVNGLEVRIKICIPTKNLCVEEIFDV